MATSLTAIAFFSFAGIGDRMPARDPIVLGQREIILGNWPGKNSAGLPTPGDETAGESAPCASRPTMSTSTRAWISGETPSGLPR